MSLSLRRPSGRTQQWHLVVSEIHFSGELYMTLNYSFKEPCEWLTRPSILCSTTISENLLVSSQSRTRPPRWMWNCSQTQNNVNVHMFKHCTLCTCWPLFEHPISKEAVITVSIKVKDVEQLLDDSVKMWQQQESSDGFGGGLRSFGWLTYISSPPLLSLWASSVTVIWNDSQRYEDNATVRLSVN